jgi:hypothetical protein
MKPKRKARSKRFMSLILSTVLFVGLLGPEAAAFGQSDRDDGHENDDHPPAHSTFRIVTTLPSTAIVEEAVPYTVTLQTVTLGKATYGNVYTVVETKGDGDAEFKTTDANGREVSFKNRWDGRDRSFHLPPQYDNTTAWEVTFSKVGIYHITYRLMSPNGHTIAKTENEVSVDLPSHSKYKIQAELPAQLGAGQSSRVPVSVSTEKLGKAGLDNLHWEVAKLSGNGDVLFIAGEGQGAATFRNSGTWPDAGFSLPAMANATADWTLKFSKIGDYQVRFRLIGPDGEAVAETIGTVTVIPAFVDLGQQIYNLTLMRGAFGKDASGRNVGYTVVIGTPAKLIATDVKTGETISVHDLAGASGAWGVTVASDGKVYAGSYGAAHLYQYDPQTDKVTDLGEPIPGTTQIFELTAGPDGKIFGGAYPSGGVFEYDPAKGFTNFGTMVEGQSYARSVAFDPEENALYVGIGTQAHLIRYNIASGSKEDILPAAYANHTSVYDLNLIDGKLFLKMEPDYKQIVMDKKTRTVLSDSALIHSRGMSPKSPYANESYFTYGGILKTYDLTTNEIRDVTVGSSKVDFKANVVGWSWVQLNEPDFPGLTLVGYAGNNGSFFRYNPQTGALQQVDLPLPKQPIQLHTIAEGPDGGIYSGGFLSGGTAKFDPGTGHTVQLSGLGQQEGMAVLNGKMYFGIYPGAIIDEYDPSKAWKNKTNPKPIFELKTNYEQDRPFAMLGVDSFNKLFIGTVPDYGKLGGALTVYDASAGTAKTYRNLIPNQSVVSLAYLNGMVYGGSSISGGLGSNPVESEAKLFIWDVAGEQKVYETVPVQGKEAITSLIAGPDGNIWGMAMGTLFIFDPVSRKVIYSEDKFPEAAGTWRDASLVNGMDGQVYGTIAGKFFKIDPATKQITILRDGDATLLAGDELGNLYFVNQNDLWRYTVQDNTVAVTGIEVSPNTLELNVNQDGQLSATVQPSIATWKDFVWSSSNAGVATVSASGLVHAVAAGTAVITATTMDGNYTATATVTVKEPPKSTYKFSFPAPQAVAEGTTTSLSVTLQTDVPGPGGYTNVHITAAKTSGPGDVTFTSTNPNGQPVSFVNSGDWGLPGFDISAQYQSVVNWNLSFSQSGAYTLTFKLVDNSGNIVAEGSQPIEVLSRTLENGGFEAAAVGAIPDWQQTFGTTGVSVTSSQASEGTNSLQITDGSSTDPVGVEQKIAIEPGRDYKAAASVLVDSGKFGVHLRFYDKTGNFLSQQYQYLEPTGGAWTKVEVTGTAPDNAAQAGLLFYSDKTNTGTAYFDDASLTVTASTYSTYKFKFQAPQTVVSNVYTTVPVTLVTDITGTRGYRGAHIEVSKIAGTGDVTFSATDAGGQALTFVNAGTWGSSGFDVPQQADQTTNWSMLFSAPGAYTLNFRLVDENGAVITESSRHVLVQLDRPITVQNGGFEEPLNADGSIPGWNPWSASVNATVTGSIRYSGANSLQFSDNSSNAAFGIQTTPISAEAGKTYQAAAVVYNTGGTGVQLYLQFLDGNGARIGTAFTGISGVKNDWTPITVTGVAPAGTVSVNILLYTTKSNVTTLYLDDVSLSVSN